MKKEIWSDILGYEGKYQASNFGRVRSLNYHRTGQIVILKTRKANNGYYLVNLYRNGNMKTYLLHRLVWEAFNGPIPMGFEINHINEKKEDCSLQNLNLMTPKENTNWGTRTERAAKSISIAMTNGAHSKMVIQYDLDDNPIKTYPSIAEVERQTGYKAQNIWRCCAGKRTTSHNYKWKYA